MNTDCRTSAAEHAKNMKKSGRKPKLCMEGKLLATLEYLQEYRTMAHIAASYGIAESNIHTTIRWVENTLIKDGIFSLPGKRRWGKTREITSSCLWTPLKPRSNALKKNSGGGIPARKSGAR